MTTKEPFLTVDDVMWRDSDTVHLHLEYLNAAHEATVKKAVKKFKRLVVRLMRDYPCSVSVYPTAAQAAAANSLRNYFVTMVETLSTEPEEK